MAALRRIRLASLLALLCAGCGVFEPSSRTTVHGEVALPADVAATLLSAALCDELHAEPAAHSCGAPARRTDDGFVVRYERGPGEHWLPHADRRLSLRRTDGRGGLAVRSRELREAPLAGFAARRTAAVEVSVVDRGARCEVRFRAPADLHARLGAVVHRTLELAVCDDDGGPGAAEANLVVWRLGRLLARAHRSEHSEQRAALLRAASRLPDAPSEVFEQLAELLAAEGQCERAVANLRRAALLEPDPARRAALAQSAADASERQRRPAGMRSEALDHLMAGDLPGAEQRLHSARRSDPAPAVDYHLLSTLHRHRGDEMAALAAELLAREYEHADGSGGSVPMADRTDTWAQSMTEWSRRLTLGAHPVRASAQLYGVQRLGASPGR
ncbi:MAG: hypothetical protein ACE37K_00305 [Planctomycetota bacterium]